MKPNEIKEIKNCLPENFYECVLSLEKHAENKYFTSWSFGNQKYILSCFWADEAQPCKLNDLKQNHSNTLFSLHPAFDLASLTKPFFINAWLRQKWGSQFHEYVTQTLSHFNWQHSNWNKPLLQFIDQYPNLTFNTFLSHESCFKPWTWVQSCFLNKKSDSLKQDFLSLLLSKYSKSYYAQYSDLNYMFLILMAESLWPCSWQEEIKNINTVLNSNFFHAGIQPLNSKFAIPSYPYLLKSTSSLSLNDTQFGPVHDTNANILASLENEEPIISSHAGFYGNIFDVLHAGQYLNNTQPKAMQNTLKNKFLFGLEQKNNTLGHLGYTGTSFWFKSNTQDFNKYKCSILLTNRTASRKTEKISSPRILIISNLQEQHTKYFVSRNNKYTEMQSMDVQKIIDESSVKFQKIWNNRSIPVYQNLNEVRKEIEIKI